MCVSRSRLPYKYIYVLTYILYCVRYIFLLDLRCSHSMLSSFEVPMCWKETANASDVSKQYREREGEKNEQLEINHVYK